MTVMRRIAALGPVAPHGIHMTVVLVTGVAFTLPPGDRGNLGTLRRPDLKPNFHRPTLRAIMLLNAQ